MGGDRVSQAILTNGVWMGVIDTDTAQRLRGQLQRG